MFAFPFRLSIGVTLATAALLAASTTQITRPPDLLRARDTGDAAVLDKTIKDAQALANQKHSRENDYRLALAYSFAAEAATEDRDKAKAQSMAEAGLAVAQKLTAADDKVPEYHRLLANLCGQVIPANPVMGTLKYGPCARDEINKALQMDPNFALAYVTRGVGNYYLPEAMGGGPALSLSDFDKAISLDPKLSDAYLWKGLALRKLKRNGEAHAAIQKSLELDPTRVWAKEQLAKTPAQ